VKPQKDLRLNVVYELLEKNNFSISSFDAIVGSSGRLPPVSSGTYEISDEMLADTPYPLVHAAQLGSIVAREIADRLGVLAYTVDPTTVDDLTDEARMTGIPGFERTTIVHALNQRAMARRCCEEYLHKEYSQARVIVAHLGGGITVGAHVGGKIIEVNNASGGEGPFSPERAGAVPILPLLEMCFDGKHTKEDVYSFFRKTGGVYAHLGTSDMFKVENMAIEGNEKAKLVLRAMSYKIVKEIGGLFAIMGGHVDAIIITGGLAHADIIVSPIREKIENLAPVYVYPGEDELKALALGALRVLRKQETPVRYVGIRKR
jgi:butyrate kinase